MFTNAGKEETLAVTRTQMNKVTFPSEKTQAQKHMYSLVYYHTDTDRPGWLWQHYNTHPCPLEPDRRRVFHTVDRYFVTHQSPDIVDAISAAHISRIQKDSRFILPDHGRSLQTQPPAMHPHVLGETHRLQHLGTEHSTIAYFHPAI